MIPQAFGFVSCKAPHSDEYFTRRTRVNADTLPHRIEARLQVGEELRGLLAELAESEEQTTSEALFLSFMRDARLSETEASYVVYLAHHCATPAVIEAARRILHDPSEPKLRRISALDAIAIADIELLHVDLVALLGNPGEPAWIRAEVAEKIGAQGLSDDFSPLLNHVMTTSDTEPEVLFWCLYACSVLTPNEDAIALVSSFLEDQRVVTILFGTEKTTSLAEEATWALARLRGDMDVEPTWVLA